MLPRTRPDMPSAARQFAAALEQRRCVIHRLLALLDHVLAARVYIPAGTAYGIARVLRFLGDQVPGFFARFRSIEKCAASTDRRSQQKPNHLTAFVFVSHRYPPVIESLRF